MPIFVGSNSDDSRIRSNRVGFAVSTANPGSASEGDVYFNSSDSGLRAYDGSAWNAVGEGGGSLTAAASGTLEDGSTVIINTDGTVGVVTASAKTGQIFYGTPVTVSTDSTSFIAATYIGSGKIALAYQGPSNDYPGTVVIGTVSGTTISFGAPMIFHETEVEYIAIAYDENADRILVTFEDIGNSQYGKAMVGQISGNNVTFGAETTYHSAEVKQSKISYDKNAQKCLVLYRDDGNGNRGRAKVATIDPSNNSVSFGSQATIHDTSFNFFNVTYDENAQKHIVVYVDGQYNAKTATISGTSVSFGSELVLKSNNPLTGTTGVAYDASVQKPVAIYGDGADDYGYARVLTVSGTSLTAASAQAITDQSIFAHAAIIYDDSAKRIVVTYRNNNRGEFKLGTVSSDGTISFNTISIFQDSGVISEPNPVYDSENKKVVVTYTYNSNKPHAVVGDNTTTNLTAGNFLGFSDAAYTNGQTATIQLVGSVDDAQSGLTTGSKFFVQKDGTLGLTTDSPNVLAGTALSGTKIKIKK